MGGKEKAAAVTSVIGSGGLGFGGTTAAQSKSDSSQYEPLALSVPQAVADETPQNNSPVKTPEQKPENNAVTPIPPQPQSPSSPSPQVQSITASPSSKPTPVKPKYTTQKYFGESTKGVAGARHSGVVTDYRPSFNPTPVDFVTTYQANIYIDLEYYSGTSSNTSWIDLKMELSIEYGVDKDKGFYIHSFIGNKGYNNSISGTLRETHKIVYLNKKNRDWEIESGFIYDYGYTPYVGRPLKIIRQKEEYNYKNSLETIEINNLCSHPYGCRMAANTSPKKLSLRYKVHRQVPGPHLPFNPFAVKDQYNSELNAMWKNWQWNSHQYNFNGFYVKTAPEGSRWQIPRRGMWMGWSRVQLVVGHGDWRKVCEETEGDSCGLNTYPLATAAKS